MSRQQTSPVDHHTSGQIARQWFYSLFGAFIALILLLTSAWFVLTGVLEIINFGWRQPMFDQFTMYPKYLLLPFPQNAIQLENGHRPILPVLLRIAEARWFSASQILQLTVGGACAFLMAAIVSISAWRAPNTSLAIRAACVATACIGIFWLGNARMLLHGNELLHVYLLGLFLLLGALSAYRAAQESALGWMSAASVFCLSATFCFGPGIAAFPAIALVAWYLRVPLRAIGILGLGIVAALITYLWILPGNEGVRGMLALRPIDSLATAMRWIASPWVNAWLGYADPPLYAWMTPTPSSSCVAHWLSGSANTIQSVLHIDIRRTGPLFVGLAGFATAGVLLVGQSFRRGPQPPIQCLALTLVLFSGALSVIIGIARLAEFSLQPDDIFADRYLPWSCMFWLGLAILLLRKADKTGPWARATAMMIALAIPLALTASHQSWAGWGEAVYRNSQQSGAAAISDVFDSRVFPDDASASPQVVLKTLDLLERGRLSMFSTAGAGRLGETLVVSNEKLDVAIWMDQTEAVIDAHSQRPAAHFRGIVTSGIRRIINGGTLVVIDGADQIVGYALPSFVGNQKPAPRTSLPRKRGFDGYIRDYSPDQQYRLSLLHPDSDVATVLTLIPISAK